jgi:hypothetical protein
MIGSITEQHYSGMEGFDLWDQSRDGTRVVVLGLWDLPLEYTRVLKWDQREIYRGVDDPMEGECQE